MTEVEKLRALLAEPVEDCERCDETEHQMHLRIRAGYDKTIADSWRAHSAKLERERNEARAMLSALCSELEGAVAHADWRAAGSPGMSVPFTGDFASATQLPSVVSRMRWWAREMRRVIGEKKP